MKFCRDALVALFVSPLGPVGTTAFVVPQPHVQHSSTALAASTLSSTTDWQTLAGLSVPPISPFGKDMSPTSDSKDLLGGKGANLAQMSSMGLAVPPGFTLTTECCAQYCDKWQQSLPTAVWEQVLEHLKDVETAMQCEFGSPSNPLLLSVRSGAAIR